MKTYLTINDQHNSGNNPEGFNESLWLSELKTEYTRISRLYYPDSVVDVRILVLNVSGYRSPVIVTVAEENGEPIFNQALETEISDVRNLLWERNSEKYFN